MSVAIAPGIAGPQLAPRPRVPAFADLTTGQRFEYKFWATEEQAAKLLRLSSEHLQLDPYCLAGPQRNISLYLDSPRRTFYDAHLSGAPDRLKLRIRTYDDPKGPAFLEVKRKVKAITLKLRTIVPRAIGEAVATGDLDALDGTPPTDALSDFIFLYQRYLVEPVMLVSARRLALSSVDDGGRFRLTLDRDIRYQRPSGTDLRGRPGAWTPVDLTARSGHEALLVLIEMKFVQAAPAWLAPMISFLGLRPTGFSKYIAALSQELAEGDGWGPLRGGFYDPEED
jgi:hypothetical protein